MICLGVLYLLSSLPFALLIHEHGHLLAGMACGRTRSRIGLGAPESGRCGQWQAPWTLYIFHHPFTWITGGYYGFAVPQTPPSRLERIFIAAAGPALNLMVGALLWPWVTPGLKAVAQLSMAPLEGPLFPSVLGLTNLWIGLYNLYPQRQTEGETDGLVILRACWGSPSPARKERG